jgi:hypothetical protein
MSVELSPSEQWLADGNPRMTHHVHERWFERTPDHSVSPETAWEDGEELPAWVRKRLAEDPDEIPDRARAYAGEGYTVVIVVHDDPYPSAVTVLRADTLQDRTARQAVLHTVDGVNQS